MKIFFFFSLPPFFQQPNSIKITKDRKRGPVAMKRQRSEAWYGREDGEGSDREPDNLRHRLLVRLQLRSPLLLPPLIEITRERDMSPLTLPLCCGHEFVPFPQRDNRRWRLIPNGGCRVEERGESCSVYSPSRLITVGIFFLIFIFKN